MVEKVDETEESAIVTTESNDDTMKSSNSSIDASVVNVVVIEETNVNTEESNVTTYRALETVEYTNNELDGPKEVPLPPCNQPQAPTNEYRFFPCPEPTTKVKRRPPLGPNAN